MSTDSSAQVCPKCGYVRKPTDTAPEWQCPGCGIAYAKYGTLAHGHAHNLEQELPGAAPADHAGPRPPHAPAGDGEAARLAAVAAAAECYPIPKIPSPMGVLHLLAGGMFLLGLALSYQMWKAGEPVFTLIAFPLFMGGIFEVFALGIPWYQKLAAAETRAVETADDDPDAIDATEESAGRVRRAQWIERGLTATVVVLVAAGFLDLIPRRTYALILIALPLAAMLLAALFRGSFTYQVAERHAGPMPRASIAPVLFVSALMIFFLASRYYSVRDETTALSLGLGGGALMTVLAIVTSPGVWGRWLLMAGILAKTGVYCYSAALIVNALFDHTRSTADFLEIVFKGTWYEQGRGGGTRYRFQTEDLDDPGNTVYVNVSGWWYEQKRPGDVVCRQHYPGYLGMARTRTTECGDGQLAERREALRKYGAEYAMDFYSHNGLADLPLRLRVLEQANTILATLSGKETHARVDGLMLGIYRAEGYTIDPAPR